MKLKSTILLAIVLGSNFMCDYAYADSAKRALIASKLFNTPSSNTNYDYNPWGAWNASKNKKCLGYDGGHSGIDIQTKDRSTNRGFYALFGGKVISVGGTYNTIAVYDSPRNRTVLYLHASQTRVKLNQQISSGTLLGYQGSTGAGNAIHVHLEVRSGSQKLPACGASSTINPETL